MTNALFFDTIMPNKYAEKKEWNVPKQKYKLSNWSEYSDALRRRGEIDVWLSEEALLNVSFRWRRGVLRYVLIYSVFSLKKQ